MPRAMVEMSYTIAEIARLYARASPAYQLSSPPLVAFGGKAAGHGGYLDD